MSSNVINDRRTIDEYARVIHAFSAQRFVDRIRADSAGIGALHVKPQFERHVLAVLGRCWVLQDSVRKSLTETASGIRQGHPSAGPPAPKRASLIDALSRTLSDPTSFVSFELWTMFWALQRAQHVFAERFAPLGTYEERLTGHLIAELFHGVDVMRELAARELRDANASISIAYRDLAIEALEKSTGGDFGLILSWRPDQDREFFLPFRFQAKRANPSGTVDLSYKPRKEPARSALTGKSRSKSQMYQIESLVRGDIGQYVYYFPDTDKHRPLPPLVQSASFILREHPKLDLRSVDPFLYAVDLATFLIASLPQNASKFANFRSAYRRLLGDPNGPPRRVVAITAGYGSGPDLVQALEEIEEARPPRFLYSDTQRGTGLGPR